MSEIYFPYDNQGCASGMKVPLLEALVLLTDELIDDGHYADQTIIDLRDSLAALLAHHNAVCEAVEWYLECDANERWQVFGRGAGLREAGESWAFARAEVDRLLANETAPLYTSKKDGNRRNRTRS